MAPLRTDSELSQRIVVSFLDFLNSVEVAPGVDSEGLEVAVQCLSDVFQLDNIEANRAFQIPSLPQLFTSAGVDSAAQRSGKAVMDASGGRETCEAGVGAGSNGGSSVREDGKANRGAGCEASVPSTCSASPSLEQFVDGLESAGHFEGLAKGSAEYVNRLQDAARIFEGAMKSEAASGTSVNSENQALAEAYKNEGNAAMTGKRFLEAIELYTLAISLWSSNAIYFANRAAAHTHVAKYEAAIGDCETAIKLNPGYSKAHSRLGTVYFAQGRYKDAIEKFEKALELDPSSSSLRGTLQTAYSRLAEEPQRNPNQQQPGQEEEARIPSFSNAGGGAEMSNLIPGLLNLASQFAAQRAQGGEGNEPGGGGGRSAQLDGLLQSMSAWLGGSQFGSPNNQAQP